MSNHKVFWTPMGLDSLDEIKNFISQNWNESVLEYFLNLVDKRIDQLRLNLELAPGISSTIYRKLVLHKNVSMFYTIEENGIKILLIWDNRQNPKTLMKTLKGSYRG